MTDYTKITVSIPRDLKDWLDCRAVANLRATNKELTAILEALRSTEGDTGFDGIYIHECRPPDGANVFYTVSLGKFGDDFFEGSVREDAIRVARAKAKELGLPASAIHFEVETFGEAA